MTYSVLRLKKIKVGLKEIMEKPVRRILSGSRMLKKNTVDMSERRSVSEAR